MFEKIAFKSELSLGLLGHGNEHIIQELQSLDRKTISIL